MPSPLRHLVELAASPATSRLRDRGDRGALTELESRSLELPAGLEIQWLGVSGYRIAYQGKSLYIDPYLSRVPLRSLLLRRQALPDAVALDRFLPAEDDCEGVLVGHTHFDHAVDAPALARRFDCHAYGSGSLANLMALHGLRERTVVVAPHRVYELGPFEVSFVPSVHSKLLLGLAVPYSGELTCEHLDSLHPGAYNCGQVWGIRIEVAGIVLYHQGSANLIDDEVPDGRVDVFLAGVAGRNFTDRYWERILPKLDPEVVVPTHYDDFFVPLDDDLDLIGNARVGDVPDEIGAVSRDAAVTALPRLVAQRG